MKLLLTSGGISNSSINDALVELLGKPVAESNALFIPTAIYPFAQGPYYAMRAVSGDMSSKLCQLGWKTLGLLELTALPSIQKDVWLQAVQEADALLAWGGDPIYLSYWLQHSGLAELLPSMLEKMVYVGVSAGSMAVSGIFGETYSGPRSGSGEALKTENIKFTTPQGDMELTFITARGAGLVDFAIIPHLDNENHREAAAPNAEKWAAILPVPVYAIDDQTAIKVNGDTIEVISEGHWKLFNDIK